MPRDWLDQDTVLAGKSHSMVPSADTLVVRKLGKGRQHGEEGPLGRWDGGGSGPKGKGGVPVVLEPPRPDCGGGHATPRRQETVKSAAHTHRARR